MVNNILLPHSKKRTTVIGTYLFLIKVLAKYQKVNLLAIMIEHTNTVMTTKDGKYSLAYRFCLNKVFAYFNIDCGQGKVGPV